VSHFVSHLNGVYIAMMKRVENLISRNGKFYFRSRVPADVQAVIRKPEIKISLKTDDFDKASGIAAAMRAKVQALYDEVRLALKNPSRVEFDGSDLAKLAKQSGKSPYIFEGRPDEVAALATNKLEETLAELDTANKRTAMATAGEDEAKTALVKMVAAMQTPTEKATSKLHADHVKPIMEIAKRYYAAKKFTGRSLTNMKTVFNNLEAAIGNKQISKITKNDMITYRAYIQGLKGRRGRQDANYQTVQKKLTLIRTFFEWARKQQNLVAENPVTISADVAPETKKEDETDKRPFTVDELETLFHSPMFTGSKSKGRRYEKGNYRVKDGKFWVPLVALYSGARIGEIKHFEVTDIVEHEGVLCFDFSEISEFGRKKKLKQPSSSTRRIPVHGDLVKMGFLDYWEQRKKESKDGLLFPKYEYAQRFRQPKQNHFTIMRMKV